MSKSSFGLVAMQQNAFSLGRSSFRRVGTLHSDLSNSDSSFAAQRSICQHTCRSCCGGGLYSQGPRNDWADSTGQGNRDEERVGRRPKAERLARALIEFTRGAI